MQDFAAKRNALFASLDDASKELKGTALDQTKCTINAFKRSGSTEMVYRRGGVALNHDKSLSRNFRGKESIFKKPDLPIGKCLKPRKAPDHQMNPHKWKKYSLADVDISDHTNTTAAFAFLQEIDKQREEPHQELNTGCKIEFKKSSKIRRNLKAIEAQEVPDAEMDKPKLRGSKLMMPEYVIGQKKEKSKNRFSHTEKVERAAGSLTLAHLEEDDEEIEEG